MNLQFHKDRKIFDHPSSYISLQIRIRLCGLVSRSTMIFIQVSRTHDCKQRVIQQYAIPATLNYYWLNYMQTLCVLPYTSEHKSCYMEPQAPQQLYCNIEVNANQLNLMCLANIKLLLFCLWLPRKKNRHATDKSCSLVSTFWEVNPSLRKIFCVHHGRRQVICLCLSSIPSSPPCSLRFKHFFYLFIFYFFFGTEMHKTSLVLHVRT